MCATFFDYSRDALAGRAELGVEDSSERRESMIGVRVSVAAFASAICVAVVLAAAPPARSAPQTPTSRMLDVWLDLRLLAIFYPETTPKTFVPNLRKIAAQLNQGLSPIRLGDSPRDVLRFRVGVVMIKRNPPAETWILYSRSRPQVWQLIDDPAGHLRIRRITVR